MTSGRLVWVRGRVLKRHKRTIDLACVNKTLNEVRVILPRSQVRGERPCRADWALVEFCVPQWWADACGVEWELAA